MSTSRAVAVLTVVAVPLMLAGHMAGRAAPTAETDGAMKASFEALQKKLPGLVEKWAKKHIGEEVELKKVKSEIKLARFTGSSDAKITLFITMTAEEIPFDIPQYVSFYLHYFDGHWTTTHADCSSEMAAAAGSLMLSIDLAEEK